MKKTSEVTNADIGSRIRAARTKIDMTQPELGSAIGVTAQAVGLYEKGTRGLSVMMLYKVAAALKIKVTALLP